MDINISSPALAYPKVRREDERIEELHGILVPAPYRWLEDPDSIETKEFVENQNYVTQEIFKQIPYINETKERLTELFNYEKYSCPVKRGGKYFYSKNDGLQNQSVLYIQETLTSQPQVLLDPNLLSIDGTAALQCTSFSKGKKNKEELYFAHGISRGGSDWQTIKVLAVHDNYRILEDIVEWVKFSAIAWTHDDMGFFYSRYPPPKIVEKHAGMINPEDENSARGTETESNQNHQIWFHKLHTPQSEDVLVYAYPANPRYSITAEVSDDGMSLIIYLQDGCKNANMIHIADLSDFSSFIQRQKEAKNALTMIIPVMKLIDNMDAAYNYILNEGQDYYFMTNLNAPRERVVRTTLHIDVNTTDTSFEPVWEEVIPEPEGTIVLQGVYPVAKDRLVTLLLKDVCNVVQVHNLQGKLLSVLPLPSVGTVGIASVREESEFFYKFTSFLYPGTIYRVKLDADESTEPVTSLFRETEIKGFDANDYSAEQVFYPSKDGTKIPMFIVKAKNAVKNGMLPTYLYGYGGFNIALSPSFSVSRLVFMQHFGAILALPNLRGGGEYGEEWHQDGMLFKKQNVFDDFHAAAEYLIRDGYTCPERLAIHGGSNGGLLVAACCNQRPDLYRCGVAAVGVMDMLRFHKFTIGHAWRSDYGDPDVKEDFLNLLKYSPLHNVPNIDSPIMTKVFSKGARGYPSMLLTTGDHDDRVVALHSYKLIAELQYKLGRYGSKQQNPLIIRIDTKAGHGAGKPTTKAIEEQADVYAYMAWCLNTPFIPSTSS